MNCPYCSEPMPRNALQCGRCGADIGWFIRRPDGTEYGPYDLDTIDLCIREARLGSADMVRVGAHGEYQSAQHLLGERFPKAPPPVAYYPTAGYAPAPAEGSRGGMHACLIVEGIMAVVVAGSAAVLVPVFFRARTKAQQTSCLSNLKQLDLGLMMYCSDYDERFPPAGPWEDRLDPYLKNRSLWQCPSYPQEQGYRTNEKLAGLELGKVAMPAVTFSLWDAGAPIAGLAPISNATPGRHNGGDNYGYTDGHAKWSKDPAHAGHLDPASTSFP